MVAIIKSGSSLHRIFNYNEQKVRQGVAKCILAENYPMGEEDLSLNQKLNRLLNQAKLNENVTRNSIHISLNFAPGEVLPTETLSSLAQEYMKEIGFGSQPFLVYRHDDAAHPHIHIVTTKIKADGSRIDTHNIGKNKSEPARKMLEKKYNLIPAEQQQKVEFKISPVNKEAVIYGESPVKNAITEVLDHVLKQYKYTSLPELNAVLKSYNILADRGSEDSRVYKNSGLYYHVLDKNGDKAGVPIKASSIYFNPGLKYLKTQFDRNKVTRISGRKQLIDTIDNALSTPPKSIEKLSELLKKSDVELVTRINKDGVVYGLTYIDHRSQCVFNGSALGKSYSAKAITNSFQTANQIIKKGSQKKENRYEDKGYHPSFSINVHTSNLFQVLTEAEQIYEPVPFQLKKSGRKKRIKKQTNHL